MHSSLLEKGKLSKIGLDEVGVQNFTANCLQNQRGKFRNTKKKKTNENDFRLFPFACEALQSKTQY